MKIFAPVLDHIESCATCRADQHCTVAEALLKTAHETAVALLAPIPDIPRPKVKA